MTREMLKGVVKEYYARIDAGDTDWVVALFREDGVYDRAGEIYTGRSQVEQLFRMGRKVRFRHFDIQIWDCDQHIFVEGRFEGTGTDGDPREGAFADHWTFDDLGKVALRRTSLFSGSAYIKE